MVYTKKMINLKTVLLSYSKKPTLETRLYCAAYPLVPTVFHGVNMLVAMRDLSSAQLMGIADLSVIRTFYERLMQSREPSLDEMNQYAEIHHKILKQAMAVPTYDEMIKIAGAHVDSKSIDDQLSDLKPSFNRMPKGPEKVKLKAEYDGLELACRFLLPMEFTSPLVAWATGASRTDVGLITHEMLVRAYRLAKQGHDNPADHIDGCFERYPGDTFIKDNINSHAEVAWYREQEKKTKKPVT
jgi:hypothetical protein